METSRTSLPAESRLPADDDYIRKLLAEADDDIARGDVAEWNLDEVKAEARRLFAASQAKPQAMR